MRLVAAHSAESMDMEHSAAFLTGQLHGLYKSSRCEVFFTSLDTCRVLQIAAGRGWTRRKYFRMEKQHIFCKVQQFWSKRFLFWAECVSSFLPECQRSLPFPLPVPGLRKSSSIVLAMDSQLGKGAFNHSLNRTSNIASNALKRRYSYTLVQPKAHPPFRVADRSKGARPTMSEDTSTFRAHLNPPV
jgi:hypothetical protein